MLLCVTSGLLTNYSGPDPEVDTNVSLGANPNTSQVAVGLNLSVLSFT